VKVVVVALVVRMHRVVDTHIARIPPAEH
jgi:hypothetical protein